MHKCTNEQQVRCTNKRVGGAAKPAAPDVVVDGQDNANDHYLEEKSTAPEKAIEKMLVTLRDMSERMNRMESSGREQGGRMNADSPELRTDYRKREVAAGINTKASDGSPPMVSLTVSAATTFGLRRQQHQAGVEALPARYADLGVNMN
uniref:Uncharacterized protein n=1 Tax=Peronospora matthiolae TaxID=2874970 RepID=A0AAV1T1C0_9STRA